jgi:GNAT superfamily N-acetyltransferase
MTASNLARIKQFVRRTLPFVKYRWRIYAFFTKVTHFNKYRWRIYAALKKVKLLFYHRFLEIRNKNDLSQEIALTRDCKLEIETINESNRDAVAEFGGKYYIKNLYKKWTRYYYKNNYKGFVASLQGNIIGYLWWWSNSSSDKLPIELNFYDLRLEKNEVYMADCFIAPKYRGSGNAIEFINRVSLELKKLGYTQATGVYVADNLPAKWTYKVLGYNNIEYFVIHIFLNCIVYNEKAIFLKNPLQPYNPFALRMFLSFRNIF